MNLRPVRRATRIKAEGDISKKRRICLLPRGGNGARARFSGELLSMAGPAAVLAGARYLEEGEESRVAPLRAEYRSIAFQDIVRRG